MMDRIIGIINPFVAEQTINVYKEGQNNIIPVSVDEMSDRILELCYANNIYNVYMKTVSMPAQYHNRIAEEIEEKEICKYSEKKIRIEVL